MPFTIARNGHLLVRCTIKGGKYAATAARLGLTYNAFAAFGKPTNLNSFLDERLATGKLKENEYNRIVAESDLLAANSHLNLAKQFAQDTAAIEQQLATAKITQIRAVNAADKSAAATTKEIADRKREINDAQLQAANNFTDTIVNLFGKESEAGQAALQIKVLALAEIAMNLQKVISANSVTAAQISATIPPPAGPFLATAYKIAADAVAITVAAEVLKLEQGGIAHGPTHAQGGIQLYHRGRPAGIKIEGGEPVLTASVSKNPLLLSLASFVNQAAGGRPLTGGLPSYNTHAALGAIVRPIAVQALRGAGGAADAAAIGAAVADALRKNPAVNRWVDFQAAQTRNAFTDSTANA